VALASQPVAAQAPAPGSNLEIYLITMGPGAAVYERFGHNAIWVHDTAAHRDLIYNYGTFDVPAGWTGMLAFAGRFAMGRPRYYLSVADLQETLALYQYVQRDVLAQQLNLTPAQRASLAARLAANAEPAHRYYTYDYFRDNCSTRVRDMLDTTLGGALHHATVDRPAAGTLRSYTLRAIANDKLLDLGIDAALGPRVDQRIDQWHEMFLPAKLAQRISELTVPGINGSPVPLVAATFPLLTIGRYHVDAAPPAWGVWLAAIGVIVSAAMLLAWLLGKASVIGDVVATLWLLLAGLGGLLLLFFWWISYNVFTYSNHNLFILSPIALAVLPSVWYRGHDGVPRWRRGAVRLLVISVGLGIAIAIVPVVAAQDRAIVLLAAIPTLVAAGVAARRLRPTLAT
jgi:hypothetical protein